MTQRDVASLIDSAHVTAVTTVDARAALRAAVDAAAYWQPPSGEDVLAADPEVRTALRPLAARLATTEGIDWWWRDRAARQWSIDGDGSAAWLEHDPRATLAAWAQKTHSDEVRAGRERPRDPHASWSGTWWSTPTGLPVTVGHLPDAFDLVEDSFGEALAHSTEVAASPMTLELRTADDWVALCREFPLEVTASRRHDWYRTTGTNERWVIPDWNAVAETADAVHLTVGCYLAAAGRALATGDDFATMIAGWSPDTTVWLSELPVPGGVTTAWSRLPDSGEWLPVA